jgi:hypothetical protein
MIGQYLPNNNETVTVAFRQKFCQLNSPLAARGCCFWQIRFLPSVSFLYRHVFFLLCLIRASRGYLKKTKTVCSFPFPFSLINATVSSQRWKLRVAARLRLGGTG